MLYSANVPPDPAGLVEALNNALMAPITQAIVAVVLKLLPYLLCLWALGMVWSLVRRTLAGSGGSHRGGSAYHRDPGIEGIAQEDMTHPPSRRTSSGSYGYLDQVIWEDRPTRNDAIDAASRDVRRATARMKRSGDALGEYR